MRTARCFAAGSIRPLHPRVAQAELLDGSVHFGSAMATIATPGSRLLSIAGSAAEAGREVAAAAAVRVHAPAHAA